MNTARVNISPSVRESSAANRWRPCLSPPTTNAAPSTNRTLARIDPTKVAFTTSNRPALSAKRMTNNSGRLPSAVCRRPVALGPSRSPSASTERPTRDASAASATADTTKESNGLAWTKCSTPAAIAATTVTAIMMRSRRENSGNRSVSVVVTGLPRSRRVCQNRGARRWGIRGRRTRLPAGVARQLDDVLADEGARRWLAPPA